MAVEDLEFHRVLHQTDLYLKELTESKTDSQRFCFSKRQYFKTLFWFVCSQDGKLYMKLQWLASLFFNIFYFDTSNVVFVLANLPEKRPIIKLTISEFVVVIINQQTELIELLNVIDEVSLNAPLLKLTISNETANTHTEWLSDVRQADYQMLQQLKGEPLILADDTRHIHLFEFKQYKKTQLLLRVETKLPAPTEDMHYCASYVDTQGGDRIKNIFKKIMHQERWAWMLVGIQVFNQRRRNL